MLQNLENNYNIEILKQREIWNKKEILRLIYGDWYKEIVAWMKTPDRGINVELGCGCGSFKEFFPHLIATDIFPNPWVDIVVSGLNLPFSAHTVDNFILIDVLHHIEYPQVFFSQVQEILKPGGRIILVEPYISWFSYFIYRFLHHEPVDLHQQVLSENAPASLPLNDGFANEAIPSILFDRQWSCFCQKFPRLTLLKKKFFSFWAYPLSGGFNYNSRIGKRGYRWLHRLEQAVEKPLGRYLALRIFVVLERR